MPIYLANSDSHIVMNINNDSNLSKDNKHVTLIKISTVYSFTVLKNIYSSMQNNVYNVLKVYEVSAKWVS